VLPPQIFTCARDWPNLASAHPNWDGVPQKHFNRENLKIWPKIQRFKVNNFRASASILTGLLSVDVREAGVINWVQFLPCASPKICDSQKIVQNFARFLTTFDFDRECLRKGLTYQKSEKLVNIYNPFDVEPKKDGVLWSTNEKVIDLNKCTP